MMMIRLMAALIVALTLAPAATAQQAGADSPTAAAIELPDAFPADFPTPDGLEITSSGPSDPPVSFMRGGRLEGRLEGSVKDVAEWYYEQLNDAGYNVTDIQEAEGVTAFYFSHPTVRVDPFSSFVAIRAAESGTVTVTAVVNRVPQDSR